MLIRLGTIRATTFAGTAKPMPTDPPLGLLIAVLMPTTRPCISSSGPPELPGLIAASVWIACPISAPAEVSNRRPSALMIPVVSVPSKPERVANRGDRLPDFKL